MFRAIPKVALLSLAKKAVFSVVIAYCILTTALLMKLKPEPLVIGIDKYGTRIIRDPNDELLKLEKENFVKSFLAQIYNYDQTNFKDRISKGGDYMTRALWTTKGKEFDRIGAQLTTEDLTQIGKIDGVRSIDDYTYEADVEIKIRRKLVETTINLRVEIKIRPARRSEPNAYPWEVERYDEQQV